MGFIRKSDVMLVATAVSWTACTFILAVQLGDFADPGCYPPTPVVFFVLMTVIPVILLPVTLSIRNGEEEEKYNRATPFRESSGLAYPHMFMGAALCAALAAVLALPFLYLVKAVVEDHDSDYNVCNNGYLFLALYTVILTGHIVLCFLVAFSSCIGLLLALLLGVVSVSFAKHYSPLSQLHHQHSYHSFLVLALSLLVILLCNLYLSLQAREAASLPLPRLANPNQTLPTALES